MAYGRIRRQQIIGDVFGGEAVEGNGRLHTKITHRQPPQRGQVAATAQRLAQVAASGLPW